MWRRELPLYQISNPAERDSEEIKRMSGKHCLAEQFAIKPYKPVEVTQKQRDLLKWIASWTYSGVPLK